MVTQQLSIAFVFDGKLTPGEGVPSYILTLGDFFRSLGHKVNYIVGESDSVDPNIHSLGQTVPVRFNGNKVDVSLITSKSQVDKKLHEIQPDILHIQMPYGPFLGARFANRALSSTGIVGTFHMVPGSKIAKAGSHLLSIANKPSQQKFDSMISVSRSAQKFAKTAYSINSEVIPPPIDAEHFRHGQRLAAYYDGKINIVFMGRLVDRKGCQYLLKAVKELKPELADNIRVLVAGKGPLLDALQSFVGELGIKQLVTFLGFVKDEDKANVLASADLAVFPSTGGESFGIILAEAMASKAGVVIGGDNEGYRAVLENPETLIDPKNISAFSGKLNELITDASKRKQLHEYQQELVKQFDISVVGPRVLEVYKTVLTKKHSLGLLNL